MVFEIYLNKAVIGKSSSRGNQVHRYVVCTGQGNAGISQKEKSSPALYYREFCGGGPVPLTLHTTLLCSHRLALAPIYLHSYNRLAEHLLYTGSHARHGPCR